MVALVIIVHTAHRSVYTLCSSDSCWCFSRTSRVLNNRLHNKQVNFGQSVIFSSTAAASHSSCVTAAGSGTGVSASSSLSLSLSPYDATRPSGPLTFGFTFFSGAALLYNRQFTHHQHILLTHPLTKTPDSIID